MLLAVFFGIIFLGTIIVNMIFIFILENPNQFLLKETPIILIICLIGWSFSFLFMMIYADIEKEIGKGL